MNVRFWPSLQVITYSRVARGILYTSDFSEIINFRIGGSISDDYIRRIRNKVSTCEVPYFEANHLPLSTEIQEQLVGVVLALGREVRLWFLSHLFLDVQDLYYEVQNILSWHSIGVIDRFETARGLIRNENIDVSLRFDFACRYYSEADVQRLWTNMSEDDKNSVRCDRSISICTGYWLRALESRTALDWSDLSHASRMFIGNSMNIRYFFTTLPKRQIRYECLESGIYFRRINHPDLYYCLVEMNADELRYIFRRFKKDQLYKIFKCFLLWPFQTIFLSVMNCLVTYMDADIFRALICVLLDKVSEQWKDYEYVDILKRFWNELSSQHGKRVKEDKTLKQVMKYVLEAPAPFDVDDFRNFVRTCDTAEHQIEQRGFQHVFRPWR
ncbi:uncharacterized protein NPIL_184911 [Nephila pilipes]|uniref:Uncharacterized protein n=1 Tax=Nephila pilipes TaxID=299642 RepID=A0A8X6NK12_NEPPI|nr:uncharacterized protein NPIL_184911 [Nephila pilipes]